MWRRERSLACENSGGNRSPSHCSFLLITQEASRRSQTSDSRRGAGTARGGLHSWQKRHSLNFLQRSRTRERRFSYSHHESPLPKTKLVPDQNQPPTCQQVWKHPC